MRTALFILLTLLASSADVFAQKTKTQKPVKKTTVQKKTTPTTIQKTAQPKEETKKPEAVKPLPEISSGSNEQKVKLLRSFSSCSTRWAM